VQNLLLMSIIGKKNASTPHKYYNNNILDGTQWELSIYFLGKDDKLKRFSVFGSNEYLENWNEFANIMGRVDGTNTLIKKMERNPPRGRNFKK